MAYPGFGEGDPTHIKVRVLSETPTRLTHPTLATLAFVTREIHQTCPLAIEYHSITNGRTHREIVPFELLDNGRRWHVRVYDRKAHQFRNFVITRIRRAEVLKGKPVGADETSTQDIQWSRIVELELLPHPDQPRPEITEMDYGMQAGVLRLNLQAATARYILRKWRVDCSPNHSMRGREFRLWLKHCLAIYGVKNAVLAPGYRAPDQQRQEPGPIEGSYKDA